MNFKITGTGSCVPDITKTNTEFLNSNFFDDDGNQIERSKKHHQSRLYNR